MQLTQQKSELISRFEAILEGVENKNIVAALCAKIAEEYHEQQVKSVDLADVVKSQFIWARFINWAGKTVTNCYEIESEDECREMLEGKGFTNVQVRQIYF